MQLDPVLGVYEEECTLSSLINLASLVGVVWCRLHCVCVCVYFIPFHTELQPVVCISLIVFQVLSFSTLYSLYTGSLQIPGVYLLQCSRSRLLCVRYAVYCRYRLYLPPCLARFHES